jgi:hypothetical protein
MGGYILGEVAALTLPMRENTLRDATKDIHSSEQKVIVHEMAQISGVPIWDETSSFYCPHRLNTARHGKNINLTYRLHRVRKCSCGEPGISLRCLTQSALKRVCPIPAASHFCNRFA